MNRMKILCIGDIHFKDRSLIPYFNRLSSNNIPIELERAKKSLSFAEEKIEELKPDIVIQLGDVFHTLNQVSTLVVIEVKKSFNSLYNVCKKVGAELFIIGGNHDIYNNEKYITEILDCDKHFSKSEIIDNLAFIPFYDPEYKMWYEIQNTDADFIFTHTQVKGIHYSRNRVAEEGLDNNLIYNKYVVSGHIHIPQFLNNVYFTGSLYQNSFSEQRLELPFGITFIDVGDKARFLQLENNAVDKLVTLYDYNYKDFLQKVESIDNYVIKFVSSNEDAIKEIKDVTDKIVIVPEYKNDRQQIEKEYLVEVVETKDIIRDYITINYPYLSEIVEDLLKE